MSDVKRLLEEATSLPWRQTSVSDQNDRWTIMPFEAPRESLFIGGRVRKESDAALIVEAVNRLPDYEAAVDLLERWSFSYGAGYPSGIVAAHATDEETRALLARLREGVLA